jgi:hypothetical protein
VLCGVKDNPPYLHDQRLLTLDTVEFFNLVPGDKLTGCPRPSFSGSANGLVPPRLGSRRAALRHQTSMTESPQANALLETVRRIRSSPALRQNLRKAWPSPGSCRSTTYAINIVFDDGYDTGLYTWHYLHKLAN